MISEAELVETLSPENFVAIRIIYGGTAPEETRRALGVERKYESADEKWFLEKKEFLENASTKLDKIVDEIIEVR